MAIEAALIKPVVDALMALFRQGENIKLKNDAEKALREAIRELLLANPDENKAQARIAIAKAAGILSEDIVLAEDMLQKHRASKSKTAGKAATSRARKRAAPAEKPTTRKEADKPASAADHPGGTGGASATPGRDAPADQSPDKPDNNPVDKAADKSADKLSDKPVDKPAAKSRVRAQPGK